MSDIVLDEEIDALRAIADRVRLEAESVTYGWFPGGDPREFSPDPESSTDAELARHRADCEAWEAGEGVDRGGPHVPLGDIGHLTLSAYGLGSYTWRDPVLLQLANDLDAWIDRVRQL